MQRKEVIAYLKKIKKNCNLEMEKMLDESSMSIFRELSEIDGKIYSNLKINQYKEVRTVKKPKNLFMRGVNFKKGSRDDELDEMVDGDEGIINRRLPLNSHNH